MVQQNGKFGFTTWCGVLCQNYWCVERFREYRIALRDYAKTVYVPGIDVALDEPVPLEDIYVEQYVSDPQSRRDEREDEASQGRPSDERPPERKRPLRPQPVRDALAEHQRLVILGEPGQGKSTLIRRYALQLTQEESKLPLLVELGRARLRVRDERDNSWLFERIPDDLRAKIEPHWSRVCELIKAGQTHILLDGYDELRPDGRRQVRELASGLPSSNQVVLSSRPHAYQRLVGFETFELAKLQPAQVESLAENVCTSLAASYGLENHGDALAKVRAALKEKATDDVAGNPLLLSFLCLSAVSDQAEGRLSAFPTHPVQLIGHCVAALAGWHRNHKDRSEWPPGLDGFAVTSILGPLALKTFENDAGVIRPQDLKVLKGQDRERFDEYLEPARFVHRRGETYEFPLETFREYFAAQAVAANKDPFAVLKRHLHSPEWRQVILYTAGSLEQMEAKWLDLRFPRVVRFLVLGLDPIAKVFTKLISIGALQKAVEEGGKALSGPAELWLRKSRRSAEFLVTRILRSRSPYERILRRDLRLAILCMRLVQAPNERLTSAVEARVRKVKGSALDAVFEILGPSSLVELSRDEHSGVRWRTIAALARAAQEPAVRERLVELSRDEHSGVRESAAAALAGAAQALRDDTFRAEVLRVATRRARSEIVFWKLLEAAVQVAEERG